jgi:hypothetical protein
MIFTGLIFALGFFRTNRTPVDVLAICLNFHQGSKNYQKGARIGATNNLIFLDLSIFSYSENAYHSEFYSTISYN